MDADPRWWRAVADTLQTRSYQRPEVPARRRDLCHARASGQYFGPLVSLVTLVGPGRTPERKRPPSTPAVIQHQEGDCIRVAD
jgi:hypothetical protein